MTRQHTRPDSFRAKRLLFVLAALFLIACSPSVESSVDDVSDDGHDDPITTPVTCGDGILDQDSGESCDDGNLVSESCTYGLQSCTICDDTCQLVAGTASFCGDQIVDPLNGEECDDGTATGACDADCQIIEEPGPTCGDGTCDANEDCASCATDCGACPGPTCGDGTCDANEDCASCDADCGACPGPTCGDSACDANEDCASCDADCGVCPGPACDDGTCDASESCATCPGDCGACSAPTLLVPRTGQAVTLDGLLDEFASADTVLVQSGAAEAAFRLLWDDQSLYLGVEVADASLWAPGTGRDGDALWTSDGIELMLDPLLTESTLADADDRQIMVTAAGDLLDAHGAGATADVSADLDVLFVVLADGTLDDGVADTGFTVELAIPWTEIGVSPATGLELGADLALNNASADPAALVNADWAGLLPFAQPSLWNRLVLGPGDGCGDATCAAGESCSSCPADCGVCPAVCGDDDCAASETCDTCPVDCGACVVCQDGVCAPGENCIDCPADCGTCPAGEDLTAVWANDGGDKVTRDETRASAAPASVINNAWDGTRVRIAGARNEVVGFNLILEAASSAAPTVAVSLTSLSGPGGFAITGTPASANDLFTWTGRNIELFYLRYLQIRGLSKLSYNATYDERHIPQRFQRPWSGDGVGSGGWTGRPDHNKYYPDIAVPLELHPTFAIAGGENQSIFVDIYVPENAPAGAYQGTITVSESGIDSFQVPVELTVYDFMLPDKPSAATMVFLGEPDINQRYLGNSWVSGADADAAEAIRDRHFQVAHRHKISLIGGNDSSTGVPSHWAPRLTGDLFTAANGYDGPGVGVGNGVYSIGTYGGWQWAWDPNDQADMHTRADGWVSWFQANAPDTDYFLYLTDEPGSSSYPQVEQWAGWLDANPGVGDGLDSFCTVSFASAESSMPSLDQPCAWPGFGTPTANLNALAAINADPGRTSCMYNGRRPVTGSFATEDDGVSLWVLAWTQYRMQIERWFFWESTYYNNFQGGTGETNVFQQAMTFGSNSSSGIYGETGWNYSNGDGVLFYPGTDMVFPSESYGINGPLASLRLKLWRRGLQDVDYLTMAAAIDPAAVDAIVQQMVPTLLWEYGVADPGDPTWQRTDISWSIDPDDWAAARADLAAIIAGGA